MKQRLKSGRKNHIGFYGEEIATQFLMKRGLEILQRNYQKKWGEIDIVARETTGNPPLVRFVEVKTVSYETKSALQQAVTRGTWRPEEQVHGQKIRRLHRAIESWLEEHGVPNEWVIDVLAVRVVPREKYATVKYLPNVIL